MTICKIYILKDPRNGRIFYVGKTDKSLNIRLNEHVCDSKNRMRTVPVRGYVFDILSSGDRPIIEEVDSVWCNSSKDTKAVELERYWIKSLQERFVPILNVIVPMAEDIEPELHQDYSIY